MHGKFGGEKLVANLERIRKLAICVGPSGSGKSTILQNRVVIHNTDRVDPLALSAIKDIDNWSVLLRKDLPHLCGDIDQLVVHYDTLGFPEKLNENSPGGGEFEDLPIHIADFSSAILCWAPAHVLLERNLVRAEKMAQMASKMGSRTVLATMPDTRNRIDRMLRRLRFLRDPARIYQHYRRMADALKGCDEFAVVDTSQRGHLMLLGTEKLEEKSNYMPENLKMRVQALYNQAKDFLTE